MDLENGEELLRFVKRKKKLKTKPREMFIDLREIQVNFAEPSVSNCHYRNGNASAVCNVSVRKNLRERDRKEGERLN